MRVLAFDLATRCGVCVGDAGATPKAWAVDLGKGLSDEQKWARALRMTERYIADHSPDLVSVEAPVGGREASAYLIGLAACVMGQATRQMLRAPVMYQSSTVRRHFLGKALAVRDFPGKSKAAAKAAIKQAVMDRCDLLGWKADDPDACDAIALWDLTIAKERIQVAPGGGLFAGGRA